MDSLIGHLHMQGHPISIGIDGNGLNSHFPGRLDNPACDFATVCDQDFVKHVQTLC